MSAEIVSDAGGILTARIRGRFTQAEMAALQAAAKDSIRRQGHVGLLILTEDFLGWKKDDDWSDVSFMENDPYIRKMAIVGEEQWRELALVFTASPIRKFPVEYFQPADVEQARAWLAAE